METLTKNTEAEDANKKSARLSRENSSLSAKSLEKFSGAASSPLLTKDSITTSYTFDPENGLVCQGESPELARHGITDTMMYRTKTLTTWEAFEIRYTTVWTNPELWKMMCRLFGVSVVVCFITVLIIPDPGAMKVAKFTSVSKFLNVVVGLLLGFFLSSSMNRWYSCVNGFLELLDSIRNLQMQFVALGVPEEQSNQVLRFGFASGWLLYGQLLLEASKLSCHEETERQRDILWISLREKVFRVDKSKTSLLLTEEEENVLRLTRDPPGMMWMWIAALIGRISQDGWIPPMASPTYGRIMNLCQSAHGGIRQVRASISVQAPLTYTHLLATLVHMNNLLNALTLGVVAGLALGLSLIRAGWHFYEPRVREKQITQDGQNLAITMCYCFFGPLIYQALLLIGMNLAQPFDSVDAKMPVDRLLHQLEIDMCNGRDLVDHMSFEKPAFKQKPKPAPKQAPAA
jgi:hypothetical protein